MKKMRHPKSRIISVEIPVSDFGDGEIFSPNAQPPLPSSIAATPEERLAVDNANDAVDQVSNLAYLFWQSRGCPEGSPEVDWFRAEQAVLLRADRIT